MPKKPPNLIYDVNESPPLPTLILLGFQHIFILSIAFIFPVVIVEAVGGTQEDRRNLISMAMIATGAGTILQGLKKGPIGSGYLCPLLNGPAFLSASLMAGKAGGFPLIFGMTVAAGVFEALFSRVVSRMRAFFPAEVTGTIVTMVGIEIVSLGVRKFLGVDALTPFPNLAKFSVALITLVAMVGFNVWGKGALRLYSVLLGLLVGYVVAFLTDVLTVRDVSHILNAPFLLLPSFGHYGLSFDGLLVIPFLVAALSSALKTMGDLTTCQRINDSDWKRPEMASISRGILACAIGNIISGLTGALGQSVSSSNVGLSIATGATSRKIAYSVGVMLIILAFVPKLGMVFAIMPTPVMGACLVFAACFMILAGIQIMMSRMIDARKTFVIGISIVFGLSVELMPQLYRDVHPWIRPLVSSGLSVATLSAIILNMIFRMGIARTVTFELLAGRDSSDGIFTLMEKQGALWGALKDVIYRASQVIEEFLESVAAAGAAKESLHVEVRFDEFNLDVRITYKGLPITFAHEKPSEEELLSDPEGVRRLSTYLVRKLANRIAVSSKGEYCTVHFHFDH